MGKGDRRWRTTALVLALGSPAVAQAEPEPVLPPGHAQAKEIHDRAHTLYEDGHFSEAARAWAEILTALPENAANREVRLATIVNLLEASKLALHNERDDQGNYDQTHLQFAEEAADGYVAGFHAAYGETAEVDPRIAEAVQVLRDLVADEKLGPCLTMIPDPDTGAGPDIAPCLNVSRPPRGCGTRGGDLSLFPLLLVPALGRRRRRREMLDELSSRLPPDVVARLAARDDDDG